MKIPAILSSDCIGFPNPKLALNNPNGLLAIGGDLSIQRLRCAYKTGIFPWYEDGMPILWWSPEPRMVLYPAKLKIRRSLHKKLIKRAYQVSFDKCFNDVIECCSQSRKASSGTWISAAMITAYNRLHKAGLAHSVEVWMDGKLAGGLYGINIGRIFFGESMFHKQTDASKIALVYLAGQLEEWKFPLIDCQVANEHLSSMGATNISRTSFMQYLRQYTQDTQETSIPWRLAWTYKP